MLEQDPNSSFEDMKTSLVAQIKDTFPVKSRDGATEVRLVDVEVDDKLGTDDIKSQADARMTGKSWAVPIMGTVEIVDLASGKVLTKKRQQLGKMPKMTRHFSYIVGGQERYVANQWRLRPGVYVKKGQKAGEVKAQFQLAKGKPFSVSQRPNGEMIMTVSGSSRKIPAYSIMAATGVTDAQMEQAWGKDIFDASKAKAKSGRDTASFIKVMGGVDPEEGDDHKKIINDLLAETKMDPIVAKMNVGLRQEQVDGAVLLNATRKLVDVAAGRQDPDPIDSLRYKELWTTKDHLVHRMGKAAPTIERRIQSAIGKKSVMRKLRAGDASAIRDVVMPDLIQRPMFSVFNTSLESVGKQTNPLSMMSNNSLTTIKGEGGITNTNQIKKDNQVLDPSHLGFLDPVFTPESDPGVNTHLAFGVKIRDRKPYIRLYNTKTKKVEEVDAAEAAISRVALPDQVKWKGGRPSFATGKIRMSDEKGEIVDAASSKADYVMLAPSQVFATETNLVPFMGNDSAGRTSMSARHMAQAISIVGREAPKVQVLAAGGKTFEELVGSNFLAHKAPEDGTVVKVEKDMITMADKSGKQHGVHIYDHYPTNDPKGMLESTPIVAVGDKVKKGQGLADNNYSDKGKLAIGTNLQVAYLANGDNHEDGIVISESAAKKLGSVHLSKPSMLVSKETIVGKEKFLLQKQGLFSKDVLKTIGDDGIARVGQIIEPGGPLILALGKKAKTTSVNAATHRKLGSQLRSSFNNSTLKWNSSYPGEVIRVVRSGKDVVVHVKTFEPAQEGSKLSTRHSAKGIISKVLPDDEMPHDKEGKPVQVLLNPVGVVGRMNPGQIMETVAGKIADKTGKPYKVKNFDGSTDYLAKLQGELKKHGLEETEDLFDPKSGRKLGKVTVGPHYMFQLEHQIDKKTSVRSGGFTPDSTGAPSLAYEAETQTPRRGGKHGAQSLGSLGVYGALAANLDSNLEEMMTQKSDASQAMEVWGALTNGERVPPPKVPFTFTKFKNLMQGMGVDMQKEGSKLKLIPMTDAEILAKSSGAIKKPDIGMRIPTDGGPERADKHGLFGTVTGGPQGERWSHINLAEPMPNPIYSKAIVHSLGLDARSPDKSIERIISGEDNLDGKTGPKAITDALKKINTKAKMRELKAKIDDPKVTGSDLNKLNYQYKALRSLSEAGKNPGNAWVISKVPVLPPKFRPQTTLRDGTIKNNPLNQLYRRLGMVNSKVAEGAQVGIPYNASLDTRTGLYQELQNLMGTTPAGKKASDLDFRGTKEDPSKKLPGILHMISGDRPKDGFFQDKMIGKRQDYTARATIVVDPNLSMDEVGVPRKIAIEMYRPLVAKRLTRLHGDPIKAHKQISEKHPTAMKALEAEIEGRPVLMKRDPVLHQYGLIGQKVRLTDSKAIRVSPLILPPVGGDIDGDTMALFAPLSEEAKNEALSILPSARPMSLATGDVMFKPTNESALSLYRMSIPRGGTGKKFATTAEAEKAFKGNKLDLNHKISLGGTMTTLGRARIAATVPAKYRKEILSNLEKPFDRKWQGQVLKDVAVNNDQAFKDTANKMTQLGFQMAYDSGHTVALSDLEPLRATRDKILARADKDVAKLEAKGDRAGVTKRWADSTDELHDAYTKHYTKNPNDVSDMRSAGIKAKREQFQGALMAPMLTQDPFGKASKVPIRRSFAEGVDLGGYFMQASGARGGQIAKTQSVSEPGYMSKLLIQSNLDQNISGKDCGTAKGMLISIGEKDVVDRYLASPLKLGKNTLPTGTPVTPDMLASAKANKINQLHVRSPLKCQMARGVCGKCMGVHPDGQHYAVGDRVGVVSAQSLGERAAQLMLKQTHGGGIRPTTPSDTESFRKVDRLFSASKPDMMDAATAPSDGRVTKVDRRRDGSYAIFISGKRNPLITRQKPKSTVRSGFVFKKGDTLTAGKPNIHNVLKTRGLEAVQNEMAKQVGDIYAKEGVLRRHAELTVRTATSLVKITDSGDHLSILRGDDMMKPTIDEINRTTLRGKRPIRYTSQLASAEQNPLYRQRDWIGRLQGSRLRGSLMQSATHGETSDTRGAHPIPGLAIGAGFGRRRK